MHERTDGDIGQRQGIARLDVGLGTGLDGIADLQALGLQNVRLGTICIVEQRDARGTIRVVLDGRDLGRDAILATLEVDLAILALVTATLMAGRDATIVIAAGLLRQRLPAATSRGSSS